MLQPQPLLSDIEEAVYQLMVENEQLKTVIKELKQEIRELYWRLEEKD